MNSVYLDNSSMELYHGRLDKRPNAIAVRIRSGAALGGLATPATSLRTTLHCSDHMLPAAELEPVLAEQMLLGSLLLVHVRGSVCWKCQSMQKGAGPDERHQKRPLPDLL